MANPNSGVSDTTHTTSEEMYAQQHGMTLDQWTKAGKPNLSNYTGTTSSQSNTSTKRSPGLGGTADPAKADKGFLTPEEFQAMQDSGYGQEIVRKAFTNYIKQRDAARKSGGVHAEVYGRGGNGPFNDFAQSVLKDKAYAQQFEKQAGESITDWVNRLEQDFQGFGTAFNKGGLGKDNRLTKYFAYDSITDKRGETVAERKARETAEAETKTKKEIADFAATLAGPKGDGTLDANDPHVKQILDITMQGVSDQARLRGIEGPMSAAASQQSTNNQLMSMDADHQARYFSALQYKNSDQLNEGRARDAAAYSQWASDAGAAQQRAASSPLGTALGIGGAAVGAVGGFFAGGPAGAGAGAAGGWNLGSGIGTSLSQPNISPPPAARYGGQRY